MNKENNFYQKIKKNYKKHLKAIVKSLLTLTIGYIVWLKALPFVFAGLTVAPIVSALAVSLLVFMVLIQEEQITNVCNRGFDSIKVELKKIKRDHSTIEVETPLEV